jgi:hypothetical protein
MEWVFQREHLTHCVFSSSREVLPLLLAGNWDVGLSINNGKEELQPLSWLIDFQFTFTCVLCMCVGAGEGGNQHPFVLTGLEL